MPGVSVRIGSWSLQIVSARLGLKSSLAARCPAASFLNACFSMGRADTRNAASERVQFADLARVSVGAAKRMRCEAFRDIGDPPACRTTAAARCRTAPTASPSQTLILMTRGQLKVLDFGLTGIEDARDSDAAHGRWQYSGHRRVHVTRA